MSSGVTENFECFVKNKNNKNKTAQPANKNNNNNNNNNNIIIRIIIMIENKLFLQSKPCGQPKSEKLLVT